MLLLSFHSACYLSNSGGFHAIKATKGRSLGGGVAYIYIYVYIDIYIYKYRYRVYMCEEIAVGCKPRPVVGWGGSSSGGWGA